MNVEIWKNHPTIENLVISSFGNIKTEDRYVNSGNGKRLEKGIVLKQSNDKDGYKMISFNTGHKRETLKVHRLVAQTFLKNENNYNEINHIDGIKHNNNVENLEWCNRIQNIQRAINTGLKSVKQYDFKNCKFCNKKFKETKDRHIFCSNDCSNNYKKKISNKPTAKELYNMLTKMSFNDVGSHFGVTRTIIRRWCKSYKIPDNAKHYKQ